jgi:hypothetical protein
VEDQDVEGAIGAGHEDQVAGDEDGAQVGGAAAAQRLGGGAVEVLEAALGADREDAAVGVRAATERPPSRDPQSRSPP